MYPLTFTEFCTALNVPPSVMADVKECFVEKRAVPAAVHERLARLFRLYLIVGGMPEAVQRYIDTAGDLGSVRQVHEDLTALYREDIAKYAGNRALQVKAIYEALPAQLAKENKRFQMKALKDEARFERYANDFAWLGGAKAALKVTNVTDPRPMLERSEEEGRFKLYLSDTGMLMSRYRNAVALDALSGARSVNFGSVYENAVAQALAAAGAPLHYYHNSRRGEVDFIVETSEGAVLPIEVKSGKDYKRHVALNNLLKSSEYHIDEAYVLSEANVSSERREGGTVRYLPLYMLPLVVGRAGDDGLSGMKVPPPTW